MLKNFASKSAQDIYNGINSRYARQVPHELHAKTQRLFDQINAATCVTDLSAPPSNHLEKLKGDLKDYWSLRINKQWRIIFRWQEGDAYQLSIVDYH